VKIPGRRLRSRPAEPDKEIERVREKKSAVVEEIELQEDPQKLVNIHYREDGLKKSMSVDLVVGTFGINSTLIKRIVGKDLYAVLKKIGRR